MKKNALFAIYISAIVLTAGGQTLTLDSCLTLARSNNYDIKAARMEVAKSEALKQQVFTNYFPRVSASGLGYYAANPLLHFGIEDVQSYDMRMLLESLYELVSEGTDINREIDLMKSGIGGSVTAVQPLLAGGRIVNGNKLAKLGVEASELQAEMKCRDILEEVEATYYLVAGLQQKVATVDAALALIDSLDHTVQTALANGLVTRSDALQVELKRNEMAANRQKLASGIRLAKRYLCKQIGIAYSDSIVFSDTETELPPPFLYSYADRSDSLRPEMRLLELNVEAEQLRKKLTIGETLPQIALIGSAFYGDIIKEEPSGNAVAVLSLSIPLTAWWETSHKIKQHNIAIEQARLMQDHLSQMMSLEEEKAYSDMLDAWMLMKSDSSALDIARENYRLSSLNYSAGVVTLSEVLQAHALLLQALNAITDRRTSYIVAHRRLQDLKNANQ